MKRLLIYACLTLTLFSPIAVHAISPEDKQAVLQGTEYLDYRVTCAATTSGPVQGDPSCRGIRLPSITDPNGLATAINTFIKQTHPTSPFLTGCNGGPCGIYFVNAGIASGVSPALLVAFADNESTMATNVGTNNSRASTHNPFGNLRPDRSLVSYSSWQEGISRFATEVIAGIHFKQNPTNIDQEIHIQCWGNFTKPETWDKNACTFDKYYTTTVKDINAIIDLAGPAVACGQPGSASPNNPTPAGTLPTPAVDTSGDCGTSTFASGANGFDLTGTNAMAYYSQGDPKWASLPYGIGRMGPDGCGPTSMAMIIATLKGDTTITPTVVGDYAASHGAQDGGGGSYDYIAQITATHWGLKATQIGGNMQLAINTVKSGGLVLMNMGPGDFTKNGHFIVLRGTTADGKLLVADPNDGLPGQANYQKKSKTAWEPATVIAQQKNNMWAITK